MKTRSKAWLIVSALMLSAAVQAADVIMYQDDFNGSSATFLSNNVAPDTRPGSEVWIAGNNIFADGHFISGISPRSAFLPFTMKQGNIYTFTADVTITNFSAESTDWAGIALRTNNAPVSGIPNMAAGPAYMFVRRNGGVTANTIGTGPGSAVSSEPGFMTPGATVRLGMVIDTTDINPDNWTVTFTINGTVFAAKKDLSDKMMVEGSVYYWTLGVFSNVAGTFDNLSVTVTSKSVTVGAVLVPKAPEPSCPDVHS